MLSGSRKETKKERDMNRILQFFSIGFRSRLGKKRRRHDVLRSVRSAQEFAARQRAKETSKKKNNATSREK